MTNEELFLNIINTFQGERQMQNIQQKILVDSKYCCEVINLHKHGICVSHETQIFSEKFPANF